MQEKKLVFQEPVFIHLAEVKCPQEEVCAWPPPSPGTGYEAPWGTDPTLLAAWRLLGAGMIISPNLAPRTQRDLPGRYTAEERQVALPGLSHTSHSSASRAPPGLKPRPGWPAPARCSQAHPAADLPAPETRAPATGLGLQGKLTVVATGLRTQQAGVLASVTRREQKKGVSLFQEAVAIAGEKRAPGREAMASRVVALRSAPAGS